MNSPTCPRTGCNRLLGRVEQRSPKMLNADQFDAVKIGDWFCGGHPDEAPFIYFNDCVRELGGSVEPDAAPRFARTLACTECAMEDDVPIKCDSPGCENAAWWVRAGDAVPQEPDGVLVKKSVVYRDGQLTAEDYDEAITVLQDARAAFDNPPSVCPVCHDSGHLADRCHHNPLALARRFVQHRDAAYYRCFHCGDVFPLDDPEAAQDHFGKSEDEVARCLGSPPHSEVEDDG